MQCEKGAISCDSCKLATDQKSIPTRLFDRRVDDDEDIEEALVLALLFIVLDIVS